MTAWQAAHLLVSLTFLNLLFLSCFLNKWGLLHLPPYELHSNFFLTSFIAYFFTRLLPLPWIVGTYTIFWLLILLIQPWENIYQLSGYFLGLGIAVAYLRQINLWLAGLAPLIVHFSGLVILVICAYLQHNPQDVPQQFEILSWYSLQIELLAIYPLTFAANFINKQIDWFRILA